MMQQDANKKRERVSFCPLVGVCVVDRIDPDLHAHLYYSRKDLHHIQAQYKIDTILDGIRTRYEAMVRILKDDRLAHQHQHCIYQYQQRQFQQLKQLKQHRQRM